MPAMSCKAEGSGYVRPMLRINLLAEGRANSKITLEKARAGGRKRAAKRRLAQQAYNRDWLARNPDKAEKYRKANRAWWASHKPEIRARRLLSNYGLTVEAYEALWASQNGCCAICTLEMRLDSGAGSSAHVDHDHTTGKVRALLCGQCNMALGKLQDSSKTAQAAADYLRRFGK